MKKILTLFCAGCSALLPAISLTSCAKKTSIYTQQAIDEFMGNEEEGIKGITSCPRPGKYYDAIIPYLKNRAMQIAGLSQQDIHVDDAHNIYFDIPATQGYEGNDMVILQGHTDMVVAGLSEQEAKTTPIDAVIENNTIHSRDHKTSLGADNGIGIAIALTILKNRNNFVHGPLRFLMTADEDIGMIGAQALDPDWLKINGQPIKWLINIDAEKEGYVYRSCAGNSRFETNKIFDPSTETALSNEFTLTFDGLIGGHSAIDITKKRANADRLAFEFLYDVLSYGSGSSIQIVSHNHERVVEGETKEINYSKNQLIANCKLTFKTNLDNSAIQEIWSEDLARWKSDQYSQDDWKQIEAKSGIVLNTTTSNKFLSSNDSKKLIELMGDYTFDPKLQEKLPAFYYGVVDYFDEEKTFPKSSINLGPINIAFDSEKEIIKYTCGASTRSAIGTSTSSERFSINWLRAQYENIAEQFDVNIKEEAIYYPWLKDENNELVKLLYNGYKTLGAKAIIYDDLGGVEPAMWTQKSNNKIVCACVGPRIDNAHSINETLYINTIDSCILNILQTLTRLTEINKN